MCSSDLRLQLAGFTVTEVPFGTIKTLSKEAAEKGSSEPTLVCSFGYVSVLQYPENWNSFQTVQIHFYDLEKGDLVFKVVKYKYSPLFPENTELNRLFAQISDNFFPGQPNPFIGKK